MKMTIKLDSNNKFINEWCLGENTLIFEHYAIVDYVQDFGINSQFYEYKDGYLEFNYDLHDETKTQSLISQHLSSIERVALEREAYGFEFIFRGQKVRQSCSSRDKELAVWQFLMLLNAEDDYTFKWKGFRDENNNTLEVEISKIEFMALIQKASEYFYKLVNISGIIENEVKKLTKLEDLEYLNIDLLFTQYLNKK